MTNPTTSSHGQYLTLIKVTGIDNETLLAKTQEIHESYMGEFEARGAMTVMLLALNGLASNGSNLGTPPGWTHVLRYFGPTDSVEWLRNTLVTVAAQVGATLETVTYTLSDITGRNG